MENIAFVLTTLDSHARHRIDDFVAHSFNVQVYAIARANEAPSIDAPWPIDIIGCFDNVLPYHKRLAILYKGIKSVAERYKGKTDVCFYYLGLDIAIIATSLIKHPYIFEECDLSHTRIRNTVLRRVFEYLDRRIIRNALHTVLTSKGFLDYHHLSDNSRISILPNKLPISILEVKADAARQTDIGHLSFGFAGSVRYKAITCFASTLVRNYPQHEFHFFGVIQDCVKQQVDELRQYPNCHFHGRFQNPVDLPAIYSQLDFTIATYDTRLENVRYAEPNKIYEAIFFRTPIIVSSNTFLADQVENLQIGLTVDAMNETTVKSLIDGLTLEIVEKMRQKVSNIPVEFAIENNDDFFNIIKKQ